MNFHCTSCGAVWATSGGRPFVRQFYRFPEWEHAVKIARDKGRKLPKFPSRRQQRNTKRIIRVRAVKRLCGDCRREK